MIDTPGPADGTTADFRAPNPTPTARWSTVADLLRTSVAEFADREAIASPDTRLTYRDLDERAATLARGLLGAGITKYSRVGFVMPNGPQWIATWLAITRIGAVAVPLSTFASGVELRKMVAHADCAGLLVAGAKANEQLRAMYSSLQGEPVSTARRLVVPDLPHLQWIATDQPTDLPGVGHVDELIADGAAIDETFLRASEASIHASDPATMIYTSGSTSAPKGVIHTHATALIRATEFAHEFSMRTDDRVFSSMPFFWVGGLGMVVLPTIANGGCIMTLERPTPDNVIDLIERERPTRAFLYPVRTMMAVMTDPRWATTDLSSVKRGLPPSPGVHVPEDEPNSWNMSYTTHRDGMGLGMSETFAAYWWGVNDGSELLTPPMQRVSDGWEVRVVDEDGQLVNEGQEGEVPVRGPSLCVGLQKMSRDEAFDPDGFYRTGDLALFEGGVLRFRGRRGDMIKSAGANVAAEEVAAALRDIEGVAESFVVGIPDAERGAVPAAAVVAEPGASVSEAGLLTSLSEVLAGYKMPRRILVVDSLDAIPMTPTGKLRQHELRDMLTDGNSDGAAT